MSLQAGLEALKNGQYQQAVQLLEQCCRSSGNAQEVVEAQMGLVKAYPHLGEKQKAIAICQQLLANSNPQVQEWAKQIYPTLGSHNNSPASASAGRAATVGVKLAMGGIGGNLALASGITMTLLFGMVFVLSLAVVLIIGSHNPSQGLIFAIAITLIFNTLMFFLAPFLMDITQRRLYKTRWVDINDIEVRSPETVRVIRRVCQQKNLKMPRLGIIDDQNPTAFTYGSLPNSARLVVSEGLFKYLDDDEIATVYAHELGHIVHWDFAVMTIAASLVQICYLIYVTFRRMARGGGNDKMKDAMQSAALAAYVFYLLGTYMVLYLSRTREYFADHFAAETTGNPNALSRALVKIAYGIVEEGARSAEPSRLIQGTRSLGIYDPKAASSTGMAYRIASDKQKVGRVFLWDIFNPWGWWMELNSTHPLTGKRVRALSTYAEQLGLEIEFDMGRIIGEGKHLDKKKLYGDFLLDVALFQAETIGFFAALILAFFLIFTTPTGTTYGIFKGSLYILGLPLVGFGFGLLIKTLVMYPSFGSAEATDILTLMSNPYASPLRGKPAQITGELIGRGDAGYQFGSDMKIQDRSGLLYLRYASRLGPIGNFLFGMKRVESLIGQQVNATGWFRRGIAPWMDVFSLTSPSGTLVKSYHRFWSFLVGGLSVCMGLFFIFAK